MEEVTFTFSRCRDVRFSGQDAEQQLGEVYASFTRNSPEAHLTYEPVVGDFV
jgi:hypothetical protein